MATVVGEVRIQAVYGLDRASSQWISPVRQAWGMKGGERVTPVLAERLCYTAVCTGSYESAARVADKWGVKTDDSSIHRYVAAAGERAAAVESRQVERALDVSTRSEVVEEAAREIGSAEFSLVIEMDGWLRRERGSDWAMKPAEAAGSRVEWHENKTATIFRVEDRGQSMAGRSFVVERFVVCCRLVGWSRVQGGASPREARMLA